MPPHQRGRRRAQPAPRPHRAVVTLSRVLTITTIILAVWTFAQLSTDPTNRRWLWTGAGALVALGGAALLLLCGRRRR